MREIVLDTETTGFDPETGDRIVEIGAVELHNHVVTGRTFHQCNPTLAAVGPLSGIMRQEAVAERLGYRAAHAAE